MIDEIAEALLALADPPVPLLVRLRNRPHGDPWIDVAIRPCTDVDPGASHPADVLMGFNAPIDWCGIGVVAAGRARSLAPHGTSPDDPQRVLIAYFVMRDGSEVTRIRGLTPAADHDDPAITETAVGLVPDLLRRTLGLPTLPAERGVQHWIDSVWLDRVVAEVTAVPTRRWQWAALAQLHPLAVAADRSVGVVLPAVLRTRTRQVAARGWRRIRTAASTGGGDAAVRRAAGVIPPSLAGWFDEGSLARWLIAGLPPIDDLVDAVRALLPGELANDTCAATTACLGGDAAHDEACR